MQIDFEIDGIPIPWRAHGGYGRRSFNPRFQEKKMVQWHLKSHYNNPPVSIPVSITYFFHFPIPKNTSRVRRNQMLSGQMHHLKRPDLTNLVKFYEDCLKTIIIDDDSQVCESIARKSYSDHPKTIIQIKSLT